MLVKAFLWLADKSPRARRWLFRNFFDAVSAIFAKADWWTFLNYGYANPDGPPETIALDPEDESERTASAFGSNFARLARVKAQFDPENRLRRNQNIQPTAGR